MRKFDTKVQHLKYKVLREVARMAWDDSLVDAVYEVPYRISPGKKPTMRCCVYKERAILAERVRLALGGKKGDDRVIQVIDIACDECPVGGYEVTQACRGCLAHRCEDVCRRGAITFDEHQKAIIDKEKCVECGACAKVCPYSAISNNKRPCENACKVNAISMDDDKTAKIDDSKCISCGACVYQCPFGAITDKSYIVDAIDLLKESKNGGGKVYAVVAPSISSQFSYAKLGQVITGIKALGFHAVVEAALGADMVAHTESQELVERGLLTSSCCPAFVDYIHKKFPALAKFISHNLSPMAVISKHIKEQDENAKVVFIGPCTAKKMEFKKSTVAEYVDCVLTFEELQALIDSRDLDIASMEEDVLDNASYFGRIFARSGGLTDAVKQALKEQGLDKDFELKAVTCDGIDECRMALLKLSKNVLNANFIEGMACKGGCISGAGCLTHGEKNKAEVDKYGMEAYEKTISDAISVLDLVK